MPRKIRELIRDLERAGFTNRGGKGSHRNFVPPKVTKPITLSGNPGDDAQRYLERAVTEEILGVPPMNQLSRNYVKIIEWFEEDQCYIGSCPSLFYGGCHGKNEKAVFTQLCKIVEEVVAIYKLDGKPLPQPTSGKDFANKMLSIV